jgi:hypothetical protein
MSPAEPATGLPPTAAEQLPDDPATLKRMVLELLASLHQRDRDIEGYRHRIDLLLRRLYGPRGERIYPDQLLLFAEMAAGPDTPTEAPAELAPPSQTKRRCRPHGRRRLPDNLPREPRHHELSEAERVCQGCGQVRIDIGVDRSEQLDYRPTSLLVIEHVVHKYACPGCSKRPPAVPGAASTPGTGVGAHAVSRTRTPATAAIVSFLPRGAGWIKLDWFLAQDKCRRRSSGLRLFLDLCAGPGVQPCPVV